MSFDYPTFCWQDATPASGSSAPPCWPPPAGGACAFRNAVQASQALEFVSCDLAVIGYTLEENEKKGLTNALLGRLNATEVLQVAAGDDCCASGFLSKVEEALHESSLTSHPVLEPTQANSRMV